MTPPSPRIPTKRTWFAKFSDAFRGLRFAVVGSSSFHVHLAMAIVVVGLAAWLRVSRVEWCLLILCIAIVMAAEAFNTAIESLSRAVDTAHHPDLGKSLDVASAAVLLVSGGAAIVGVIIFLHRLFFV